MHIRGFACGTAGYRVDYRTPMSRRAAHQQLPSRATPTPRRPTGGFAPLDASLRRVAGVSNRLVVQFPPCSHIRSVETSCNRPTRPTPRPATASTQPSKARQVAQMGGFAPLDASLRRVAGVSNRLVVQFPRAPISGPLKRAATAQPGPCLVTPRINGAPMHPNPRTAEPHMNIINDQIKLEASNHAELKRKALEFTYEPRSQGQRRSFHPRRR